MWLFSPLDKCMALHLYKFEFPLPKNTFCKVKLKMAQQFWKRRYPKLLNIFSLLSPLRKWTRPFIWTKRNHPLLLFSPVISLVEIGPVFLENILSLYFHYVAIIPLWQRARPFIWTNLNRLHLGMLYIINSESGEANMQKEMDEHLNRQAFCKAHLSF